jgi:hypothetical protein
LLNLRSHSRVLRIVRRFGAGVAIAAAVSGPVQAMTCPAPDERSSLTVRALQAKLMVAALSCSARGDYNQFARLYAPHLANHGVSLRRWFRKLHGIRHKREINRFVTLLANDASMRSIGDRVEFCAKSQEAFSVLLKASRATSRQTLKDVAIATNWRQDIPAGCSLPTLSVEK